MDEEFFVREDKKKSSKRNCELVDAKKKIKREKNT